MTKRHAFSLLTFMGYCFLTLSSFAMEVEYGSPYKAPHQSNTTLENKTISLKRKTNSNSNDINFCSTGQGKSHPMTIQNEKWIENLNAFKNNNKKIKLTSDQQENQLKKSFKDSLNLSLYRKLISIGDLTFYIPHGMTPTKTPRRMNNQFLLSLGKPGVFVDPETDEVVRKELHHLQQNPEIGDIVLVTRKFHKDNHNILHPFKVSKINKNEWAAIKRKFYKSLGKQMEQEVHKLPVETNEMIKKFTFQEDTINELSWLDSSYDDIAIY